MTAVFIDLLATLYDTLYSLLKGQESKARKLLHGEHEHLPEAIYRIL